MSRVALNVLRTALCVFACAGLASAAEPFSDSFEGNSIYPYWTVSPQYGSVTLSADHAYSGSQSVKFASISGGERDMVLSHKFGAPTKGDVSIAYYDVAPGQETLYERLNIIDSSNANGSASVGTQDFDAQCYTANVGGGGPNANCGIYPQETTTPVKRTPGWHVFSIFYDQSSVSIWIDGQLVYTAAGNFRFDTVQLYVAGPYWRPDTLAYFDNFSFIPLPTYGWSAYLGIPDAQTGARGLATVQGHWGSAEPAGIAGFASLPRPGRNSRGFEELPALRGKSFYEKEGRDSSWG